MTPRETTLRSEPPPTAAPILVAETAVAELQEEEGELPPRARREPFAGANGGEEVGDGVEEPRRRAVTVPVQPPAASGLSGSRRAAIFILSLEESIASRVLRCLSDEELGKIAAEIAHLGVIDKDTVTLVIREFRELEGLQNLVWKGGLDQALRLVEKTFPPERARRLVHGLEASRQSLPFSFLGGVETEALRTSLEGEHPQTIAVVLRHMLPSQAGEILEKLAPETRRGVLSRIARLEGASSEALRRLEAALRKQLDTGRFQAFGEAGGVKAVAEILRASGGGGTSFLDDLRQGRPDLAEEVNKHLFVFDDIVRLDNRALERVLKEIDPPCLARALKDADERIHGKVFNNLSRRAADALREEMEFLGPVRLAEVEAARGEILATVLRLEEAGELFISGRGREENRILY